MFSWLRRESVKVDDKLNETTILNCGLNLAMEWGENWLKPIQSRLSKQYPDLKIVELDRYNTECKAVMQFGYDVVYALAEKNGAAANKEEWHATVLSRYPWVSQSNMDRLFSQGMYYAYKDGLGH